jgi:two-component sensor histidine kinase
MTASVTALPVTSGCEISNSPPIPIIGRDCVPGSDAAADQVDLRQLRHLTNNALQSILREIVQHRELRRTRAGRLVREDLERRILLTAAVADALFGMTREPGLLSDRLRDLGEAVVALLGERGQTIDVHVSVAGECPAHLENVVVRVAHELLGNAVKHGLRDLITGCISVDLVSDARRTVLAVTDDGWGCDDAPGQGEGLRLAQLLADEHDGHVQLRYLSRETIAILDLPHAARQPSRMPEGSVVQGSDC